MNRLIKLYDLDLILLSGPGHGEILYCQRLSGWIV